MTVFKAMYGSRELVIGRTLSQQETMIELRKAYDHQDYIYAFLDDETAHALADWIIANVPKPEPVPLPTKFAAVVKSEGVLWTLADWKSDFSKWINTEGDWLHNPDDLVDAGFEVIFEGVE